MKLQTIFRRKIEQLLKQYGHQGWWPRLVAHRVTRIAKRQTVRRYTLQDTSYKIKHSPGPKSNWYMRGKMLEVWEVGVGAILTQNTSWSNVEKALLNMAHAGVLTPQEVIKSRKLESLIRPAGYYKQKSKKLKIFAKFFIEHPSVILNGVRRSEGSHEAKEQVTSLRGILHKAQNDEVIELRHKLLSLWGVGPETADTILLYGFGLPVFVVDAYTRRLLVQLSDDKSWLTKPYDEVREFCENALSSAVCRLPSLKMWQESHALIVQWGKMSKLVRIQPAR